MEEDPFAKSDDPSDFHRDPDSSFFDRDRHICFLEMMYQLLPSPYQEQEINRLTLAYFVVSGLHILRAIDRIDKEVVIDWVLSLQAHPKSADDLESGQFYGFHGSRSSQFKSNDNGPSEQEAILNGSHLASTYCALAILKVVGYDLSLIYSEFLLKSMKNLQQPDGCFMPAQTGAEKDLRFVFCAGIEMIPIIFLSFLFYCTEVNAVLNVSAATCSMLKNWTGIDQGKAKEYILSCQTYDGGFGLIPGSESHGGATYCAVASLQLMGFIEEGLMSRNSSCHDVNVTLLLDWSLQRQALDGGFQGRINKPADTCYAFWVGGVLRILEADKYINVKALREFLLTCQSEYGGFSKFRRLLPDLYHSYYGFCAFSLLNESGLNSLCVELGMSDIAAIGL